jgi:hypothetical protein
MALLSVNPVDLAHLIRERRESGGDRYDEVWDGVYVMSPLAAAAETLLLKSAVFLLGFRLVAGTNRPRIEVNQLESKLCWPA